MENKNKNDTEPLELQAETQPPETEVSGLKTRVDNLVKKAGRLWKILVRFGFSVAMAIAASFIIAYILAVAAVVASVVILAVIACVLLVVLYRNL